MVRINDAVFVTSWLSITDDKGVKTTTEYREITRVLYVANGLAIVLPEGNDEDRLMIEPSANQWPVVGRFIEVSYFFFWKRWKFIPNEK